MAKANEIQRAIVIKSFKETYKRFIKEMNIKLSNCENGLISMDCKTLVFDEVLGKELFITAMNCIKQDLQADVDIDEQLKDLLS